MGFSSGLRRCTTSTVTDKLRVYLPATMQALGSLRERGEFGPTGADGRPLEAHAVTPALRGALWEHAGLIRNARGLEKLLHSPHLLASLIARSALARQESRGGHFRTDFPQEDPLLVETHTVVVSGSGPRLEQWS